MTEKVAVIVVVACLLGGFIYFLAAWMEERWRHADTQGLLREKANEIGVLRRQLSIAKAQAGFAGDEGDRGNDQ